MDIKKEYERWLANATMDADVAERAVCAVSSALAPTA